MHNRDMIKKIIDAKVFLAPMSGITDIPFRLMARKYGCRFAFTEMIDVNAVFYSNLKTIGMMDRLREDRPLGVQIVGQDEDKVMVAAKVCEEKGYSILDLNAGCPARKVVSGGKGAALLKDLPKFGKLIGKLVKNLSIPVTVKIRSGWSRDDMAYLEAARIAEAEGVAAICIHPRTKDDMYRGKPDHEITREIKEAVKIPVFASGNIFTPRDVEDVFKLTGCDAVSVARGAFGRPWIFRDIYDHFERGVTNIRPGFEDIKKVIIEHFSLCFEYKGKRSVFSRMYKHVSWYLKGFKDLDAVMKAYPRSDDPAVMEGFIRSLHVDDRNRLSIRDQETVCAA